MPGDVSTASGAPPRVRLIVNADDFGRTEAINAAVAQAHLRGTLTSASLMVTGEAVADALRVARDNPALAVGLHLVLLGGRAALPPADIPHLVDGQGRFSRHPFSAGVRYFFSRTARSELRREIRAQFEAFASTGLPLSHVDCHHHMHLHPTVFKALLPLAREYGARAVRVPISDELLFSLRIDSRDAVLKLGWKIVFTPLASWCRRPLRRCPVPTADRVYGLMQTGHLSELYLVRLLDRLGRAAPGSARRHGAAAPAAAPVVELFCHPSLREESSRFGPNPRELATLLSPAVKAAIDANGILLTTYAAAGLTPAEGPAVP
jgi:hopanoid biosynthesis associated protein HpnK